MERSQRGGILADDVSLDIQILERKKTHIYIVDGPWKGNGL
jgi:hypothetical protein